MSQEHDDDLRRAEEWVAVPGYAGWYEASTKGRVRSLLHTNQFGQHPRKRPLVLSPSLSGRGYEFVWIGRTGDPGCRLKYVHRIVCETFHGECPAGMECAHLDGNKRNNAPANLRWCTRKENHSHKLAHGTSQRGEANPFAKLTGRQAAQIRAASAGGQTGAAIARRFGVCKQTVSNIINRKSWAEAV